MSIEKEDLPRVQIPLGRKRAGLSVDGEFVPYINLPAKARELYKRYQKAGVLRVSRCKSCGYLTTSKNANSSRRYGYTCNNCSSKEFERVFPPKYDIDGHLCYDDVLELEADEVPNTKGHLTRIKNEIKEHIELSDFLHRVAVIIQEEREKDRREAEASRRMAQKINEVSVNV